MHPHPYATIMKTPRVIKSAIALCAIWAWSMPAQAQLVPMLGAGAIQGGAAISNPAPGLMQDARKTVGAYNQSSGLPLLGGPGAMPIQGVGGESGGSTGPSGSQANGQPQPKQSGGYVVNGRVISRCSSGYACLSDLRRAMGVNF